MYGEISRKAKDRLNVVRKNSEQLLITVNQLLDLAKHSSKQQGLNKKPINLGQLIVERVMICEPLAEHLKLKMKCFVPPELIAEIDCEKVGIVLDNLLINAIKFSDSEGEINVTLKEIGDTLAIGVQDNGAGMTEEEQANVFERYFSKGESAEKGTGIGLALVKEIVELHQGGIAVESIVGKGSTFTVSLPKNLKNLGPSLSKFDSKELQNEEAISILVIEDNDDLRQYLCEVLDQYRVLTSAQGEEGLQIAKEETPDIIITDVMLPGKTGFQICRELKENEVTSHIPIIMLTALKSKETTRDGLYAGADDVINKPFKSQELLMRVVNLLATRERFRAKIQSGSLLHIKELDLSDSDKKFITKITDIVKANLNLWDLSVAFLSNEMGFSQRQLLRKVKSIVGMTPSELIQNIRLLTASKMLEENAGTVTEIAFAVGFESSSYFSRVFKQKYGLTPSQYRKGGGSDSLRDQTQLKGVIKDFPNNLQS